MVIEIFIKYPGGPTRIRGADVCMYRLPLLFPYSLIIPVGAIVPIKYLLCILYAVPSTTHITPRPRPRTYIHYIQHTYSDRCTYICNPEALFLLLFWCQHQQFYCIAYCSIPINNTVPVLLMYLVLVDTKGSDMNLSY